MLVHEQETNLKTKKCLEIPLEKIQIK